MSNSRYQQGLLVAMHRNKIADAYVVFLFDDYDAVREPLNAAMGTLFFSGDAPALPDPPDPD